MGSAGNNNTPKNQTTHDQNNDLTSTLQLAINTLLTTLQLMLNSL